MGKDQELLDAARNGHVAIVDKILAQRARRSGPLASLRRGPGANVQDSSGYTPLHHAALNGHKEIVRLLLAADASPCTVDQTGATPLHLAAWAGHAEIVRSLLAHNANPVNVDLATKKKETALHWAAQFGHVEVVSLLMARGADPLLRNAQDETPLDLAAQYGRLQTVQHLLRTRPELVQPYRAPAARARFFPNTPLHRASKNGHEQVVEVLLAAGVDVNIRSEAGPALHEAALCGKAGVVKLLLEHGAEVHMRDGRGRTVDHLLRQYTAPAHQVVRDTIDSHRQSNGFESDCDEYPPFPVQEERSPCYERAMSVGRRSSSDVDDRLHSMATPVTPNTYDHSINKVSSAALIKHHSNNFVKKITSKCLGLKAKFNSAPNISNTGLGSEVELRSNTSSYDRTKVTNTLHIGNSRFFKILAKKKGEPIDVLCNDEFDTISLDRLVTIDRLSIHNRSNRSCPGFKASLPNISENTEFSSDSSESIEGAELPGYACGDGKTVMQTYNLVVRSSLPYAILEIEAEETALNTQNVKRESNIIKSVAAENEMYESSRESNKVIKKTVEIQTEQNGTDQNKMEQSRRHNLVTQNVIDTIYENVTFENVDRSPKPPLRTVLSSSKTQAISEEPLYENLSAPKELVKPVPAKRTLVACSSSETNSSSGSSTTGKSEGCSSQAPDSSVHSSRTSTLSLDSKIDFSNFEDILMSKKSKSFRKPGHPEIFPHPENETQSGSSSSASSETSSIVSEFNTIEDVDCSSNPEKNNGGYLPMSRTLPKQSHEPETKRKLFRNVTFSSNSLTSHGFFRKFTKEKVLNYHIRGTGHCVYRAPTVKEFIYVFNRQTLKDDDVPPFTKVPNQRNSDFETAICFCRPDEMKHHKSADDLSAALGSASPKVFIDTESLLNRAAVTASSFRCYCADGSCTLHHHKRESFGLLVRFRAFNKSVSTPDLTKIDSPKATPVENPYAVFDLSTLRFGRDSLDSSSSNETSLTFGALSERSTLPSSLRRPSSAEFRSDGASSPSSGGTLRGEAVLGVASLDGGSHGGRACVRSGEARGRPAGCGWEADAFSEDALSVSSAASGSHLHHHHHGYTNKSPTPPKKPPRRNLSVSPTHANSPAVGYDHRRLHARSQDDLDDLQGAKHYLKHGRSVDHYVDGKRSYPELGEESPSAVRAPPVPNPRPSLKHRNQPVAITAMYENVAIKQQNPRRKLRRNFTHQYENFDPAAMERASLGSPADARVPLSPTHYEQPPTPDHPPPSARHAENSIHERIRPLSQLIMEVIEEIRLRKELNKK